MTQMKYIAEIVSNYAKNAQNPNEIVQLANDLTQFFKDEEQPKKSAPDPYVQKTAPHQQTNLKNNPKKLPQFRNIDLNNLAISPEKAISYDYISCAFCGKAMRNLSLHLVQSHSGYKKMTFEKYIKLLDLSEDYPRVSEGLKATHQKHFDEGKVLPNINRKR